MLTIHWEIYIGNNIYCGVVLPLGAAFKEQFQGQFQGHQITHHELQYSTTTACV